MSRHDVTDLVPDHARQLVLAVGQGQDSSRHVDESAGERKSVGLGIVRDLELVRCVRPLRDLSDETPSKLLDISDEGGVSHEAHGLLDLARRLLAELSLLPRRDHRGTGRSSCAAREGRGGQCRQQAETAAPARRHVIIVVT